MLQHPDKAVHRRQAATKFAIGRIGNCLACRGAVFFFGSRDRYVYGRCESCKTIQLVPMPSDQELAEAYANDYATSGHHGRDAESISVAAQPFYEAIVHSLREAGVGSGRILDVGCGWGGMLRTLQREGFDGFGVDFESASLEHCRKTGLAVAPLDLAAIRMRHKPFDAAVMAMVFEHLSDHRSMLDQVGAVVRPGGVLVILTPTARLFGALAAGVMKLRRASDIPPLNSTFVPPWHTSIFSVDGFRRMLEGTPFRVERVVASPSGSAYGVLGVIQSCATIVATGGFRIAGERWPLVLSHIFVCRRRGAESGPTG